MVNIDTLVVYMHTYILTRSTEGRRMYVWMDGRMDGWWPPGLEMLILEEHRFLMNSLYKSVDLEHVLALRVLPPTGRPRGELLCMYGCMDGWMDTSIHTWHAHNSLLFNLPNDHFSL